VQGLNVGLGFAALLPAPHRRRGGDSLSGRLAGRHTPALLNLAELKHFHLSGLVGEIYLSGMKMEPSGNFIFPGQT
jgi:hypothetical protein